MAVSIFDDQKKIPKVRELEEVLGNSTSLWFEIIKYAKDKYEEISMQWKHYGKKTGWCLLIKHKKRTIVYLIPEKDYFMTTFVYGEKAAKAAHETDIDYDIKNSIKEAKPYMEGRSFRIEIRTSDNLIDIKKLFEIKIEN